MRVAFHEHLFDVLTQHGLVMRLQVGDGFGVHARHGQATHGVPQGLAAEFAKQTIVIGFGQIGTGITRVNDIDFVNHIEHQDKDQQQAPGHEKLEKATHATLLLGLDTGSRSTCSCPRNFLTTEDKI